MPIFFSPWNTEYGYTKSIYTLVFVSLLLVLWGIEALLRRKVEVELSWLFPILPALLLASLLSLTGGMPACVILQSATLILYFGVVFFLVANAGTKDRELILILGALLFSAFLNALFGLLQYAGAVGGGPGRGLEAMIATMGNRQFLAGFLSYLVLPAGILLLRLRRPWAWIPALLGAGFVLAVALLTRQVGVRLGLAGGLGFVALGLGLWPAGAGGGPRGAAAAGVALAALGGTMGVLGVLAFVAAAAGAAALWALGRALRRFRWAWIPTAAGLLAAVFLLIPVTTPIPAVVKLWQRQSGAVRAWDWWVGYEMWRDKPVFGVGLGAYKILFVPYKPAFLATPRGAGYAFPFPRANQAHNEYVQVASELGTVGFLVLLAGLGLLAYFGLRRVATQTDPAKRVELLLLGGGLVAFLAHAVPTFPWHLPASALAFVAILGLAFSPRYGPAGALSVRLRGRPLRGLVGGLSLLALVVTVFAVRDITADAYLLAGQASLSLGNVPLARQQLSRAVELDFCPRVSLYWLGMAHAHAGDLPAAQAALRKCLSRSRPEILYLNLASVDLELGEVAEARALLEELLATHPLRDQELEAHYLLAVADLKEGEYLEAKRRLEELVQLDPRFERAWMLLGEIARARLFYAEARAHFQRALEVIVEKERAVQASLRAELTLAQFGELQAKLRRLRQEREAVERALSQLP
jgi:O-antigen ligase